ncbi:MAG: penicillin-binding transpeptidase domain-containing protein, partial [Oscillospiraceae bacterium]|nr:penicillin-binding transpeptidase domain-containing protein [Oscillospiraceae bacterium]
MQTRMQRRAVLAFSCILVLLFTMMMKVYQVGATGVSAAAQQQSRVVVTVAEARGTIYDRNMTPLVNDRYTYRAAVTPEAQAMSAVMGELDAAALQRLQQGRPVVVDLSQPAPFADGLLQFRVPERYNGAILAPHVIGTLDDSGLHGASGAEQAFDDTLTADSGSITVAYTVDALGRPLANQTPEVTDTMDNAKAGVVLTLDARIQDIAEAAARRYMTKGAVVVTDPATGEILALVSLPDYQPTAMAKALANPDSPLLDRALSAYDCGSVFKIVSAASALENGITSFEATCSGVLDVG